MAYSIGQLAESTGLSPHTLRYYERTGLMMAVSRDGGGRRRYDDRHVRWVRFLMRLREAGMPIVEIRRYVDLLRQGEGTLPQRIDLLSSHRRTLQAKIYRLQEHLQVIETKLETYGGGEDCLERARD